MDSSFVDSEIFPSRYGYCRFLVDYSYLVSCTCLIDILEVSYRFKSVSWYVHMGVSVMLEVSCRLHRCCDMYICVLCGI